MKGKKLISVFACSFLVLGGGTLLAVQSASKGEVRQVRADVEPNSTLDGVYSATDFNNTEFASGYNNVLITYSGTAHGLAADPIQTSEVLDKITLSSASVWGIIPWAGQNWFKVIYPNTVAAGDVLVIQAGLTIGDAMFENTLTLKLNESLKWEKAKIDLGTFTFTGANNDSAATYMYGINTTENEAPGGWDTTAFAPVDNDSGVFVDGTRVGTEIKKLNATTYYIAVPGGDVGTTATVKGNWANSQYSFSVNEFTRTWDGTRWIIESIDAGSVNLLGLSGDGPSNDHQLTLYGTTQNVVPVSWTEGFTIESGDIRKNGTPIDGVVVKKVGPQGYFFEGFTVVQNDVIKIDATITRVEGDYRYHLTITEYSIQYKGNDVWGFVDLNLGDIEYTRALPDSSASAVYLYTEATNDIPYSPDWLHIYPDGDEQVLFNGSDITEGHTIQKSGDNTYYMGLGRDAIFGDLLTIKGNWSIVLGQYEYHFRVPEISLRYSGEAWQTLAEYKESCKDVLDNYLSEDNYLPADWDTAEQWIQNGKDNIDLGTDFDDVDQMLEAFKENLDTIPTKTERAQEAAAEVDALIDDITDINRRNYDEEKVKVEAARTAYDALSEEAKGYVTKLNLLQGAEGRIRDIEAAIAVDDLISAIGEVTLEKEQQIVAARTAYDALSANQNRFVQELDVLVAAEDRLVELKELAAYKTQVLQALGQELQTILPNYRAAQQQQIQALAQQGQTAIQNAESKNAVDAVVAGLRAQLAEIPTKNQLDAKDVDDQIAALPAVANIALTDEDAIVAARAAYAALNSDAKQYVTKLSVLEAAEARLAELKTQKQHAEEVEALIDAIGNVDSTKATKDRIDAAYNAYQALTSEEKAMVSNKATLDSALANFDNAVGISRQNALDDVEEYYYGINMKKYSQENQDRINQLYADVQETIQAQEYSDNLAQIVNEFKAAVEAIPQKKAPAKKGCGGSIVATSVVLSALALAGLGLLSIKKRKED